MTAPRKGKSAERGRTSKAAGKRKLENEETGSSRSAKQPRSIVDLFSSQHSNESDDHHPRDGRDAATKQAGRSGSMHDSRLAGLTTNSVADMYSFTSARSTANGVVDLTGGTPSTESQKRKTVFAAPRTLTFNPHQGPKKLVVKNLRTTPHIDPQQYLDKVWTQEESALEAIFHNDKEPYSLEELYKGAENVCRQGKAADLYKRLQQNCKEHLARTVRGDIRAKAAEVSDVEVLKTFVDAWSRWQRQLLTIRQIFYYMDQSYLLRSPENASVHETGLTLFRSEVFQDAIIKRKTLQGVVTLIDSDRQGQMREDEFSLLRQAVDTLHELSIYTSDFEPVFISSSEHYFRVWREAEGRTSDLARYATACSDLLEREMTRCDLLTLDRSTRVQLSELFDTIFVEEEVDLLTAEDSVLDLLEEDMPQELERVYSLLERRGHVDKLRPTFEKYVDTEGTLIVFDEKREAEMVVNLLDFKRRLDHFLNFSFHKNDNLGESLHRSFSLFINKTKKSQSTWDTDNAKPGEMIAKHVDLLLKGGVKAVPRLAAAQKSDSSKPEEEHDFDGAPADEDAEINQHLSNALDLFRFVQGKAVFEAFYKKDLARRLLMGRSASFDAERNMLTRLKKECGASFTHNLESMFKDMDLAREEMMSYNQLLDDRGARSGGPDLHVNVLSASAWPTYPDVPVNIPTSIAKIMSDFETHYKSKHSGRKLTWKHALAHCQLRAKFPRGNKELVVSGFQAIVLLLFNDVAADAQLSYSDLKSGTGLPDAELRRTLQSLACAKYRVLTKHPKGRDVNDTDTFSFNAAFSDPKMRIKINQIQLKETKEENKETHQRVAADRHYETQAAIVRIMKSHKKIGHNELIVEVIKATRSRGVLDQADIKRNIEKYVSYPPPPSRAFRPPYYVMY